MGRVVRPHGVRGELSVEVLSDAPGAVRARGRAGRRRPRRARTRWGRPSSGRPASTWAGCCSAWRGWRTATPPTGSAGAWLSIPAASARPLDPGEFWPHQLVGLAVVDHQGRERGRVADVVPGAAHDLLAVELPGGASALVPAVAALVTVELDAGRVLVDAVPGLLPEE